MHSGYVLRDVINEVNKLPFLSAQDKHELSHLYETKIKNMGNAGRNGGQYYTPRPLIRTMIHVVDPKIGESIYDGSVGSAGFLCEGYDLSLRTNGENHREPQNAKGENLLRQGEKESGLHHRDHEYDSARH